MPTNASTGRSSQRDETVREAASIPGAVPRCAAHATRDGVMPRVLMVSPSFPPDTSAGAHRVRLLAPHLPAYGWEPTVLSVDPRDYEGRLDPELSELVPSSLRVVRCRALPARWTRAFGIG